MDELLKALTELIRAGSQLAYPALMGYYAVRIAEILMYPMCWGIVGFTIYKTVSKIAEEIT
jgi:hypothetical protein